MEEDNQAKPLKWKVRTLTDAYKERPPTQYIVDKLFALPSLNIVYGAPATMKSMLLADLCAAVVSGDLWLPIGDAGIETKKSNILWLDMDNGKRRSDERFEAVARARNLDEGSGIHYITMPDPIFQGNDLESCMELIDTINVVEAQLVVIDNLGLITGDVEENSARMAQIMSYMRTISENTGCALVLIHHQRKGGSGGGRAGDALRGHSSIEAAIDLAIHIMRENGSSDLYIRSTKTRGVDVPNMTASFLYDWREGTSDLYKARFVGVTSRSGDNPIKDAILEILGYGQLTQKKLVEDVYDLLNGETSLRKIKAHIDNMLAIDKSIDMYKGDRNANIYKLAK